MPVLNSSDNAAISHNSARSLKRFLPFLSWLPNYQRADLSGDLMAGIIVAIMLVPQGMAYALLAGLPPQVGLYASILPLFLYGLLGSSRALSVGPTAVVSITVVAGITPLAEPGSAAYIQLVLTLALLVGLIQMAMGLVQLGFIVNFLSHPVLVGFTAAAAIIIGFSQLKHLLGFNIPRTHYFYEQVWYTSSHLSQTNFIALGIGGASIALLFFFKYRLSALLRRVGLSEQWIMPLSKSAPLIVVGVGTGLVGWLGLDIAADLKTVGAVPAGLPLLTLPSFSPNDWRLLLPTALTISFVGYMESISVAKSLASKRRQKIDANQELIGLGVANLGATLTGGYPVTGGFSRSIVNFSAGANSGLASIITAGLVALTAIFLTPLFYYLPKTVLASIILVAVVNLIDLKAFKHIWHYNKADGFSLLISFGAVLILGIEQGILVGIAISLLLYVWRTSRPHMAIVGRIGKSEIYRNILRYQVQTWPHVFAVRIDESLYFANTKYLEDAILGWVAAQPELKHLVLIGTAINFIDASALETLSSLQEELQEAGIELHLAAIKGPVLDQLRRSGFVAQIGEAHIHFSTHDAMIALGCVSSEDIDTLNSPGASAKAAARHANWLSTSHG